MLPDIDHLSPNKESQILAGAAVVFGQDGYEGASMSRIAAEAGVSKGTLYNYFESKADLFCAFVRGVCDRELGLAFGDVDASAPPDVLLRQIGHRFLDLLLSEHGLTIFRMVLCEVVHFPTLAHAFYDNGPDAAKRWLTTWLAEQNTRGVLAIDDAGFAADQFLALIQTSLVAPRRLGVAGRSTVEQQERTVDGAVEMFLRFYRV